MNDNWALRAIEKEADIRAWKRLTEGGDGIRVLGLSVRQIRWLRTEFMRTTGKQPEDIPE